MGRKIIGVTVGTTLPKPNFKQTDPTKGDYIKNKPDFEGLKKDVTTLNELVGDTSVSDQISTAITNANYASEAYVDEKVAALVDSAPDTLNTLNELADALGDDPNFATTVVTQIGQKVDKVEGMGLSTNDYSEVEKEKLSIASEAISDLQSKVGDETVSKQIADALSKMQVKAGFIYPLASATVPDGFLLCNGAAYSRAEYPELFAVIGTTYGVGDGSTTFNVPNLVKRVPVGASTNSYKLGSSGGEETHKLSINEMPSHSHTFYVNIQHGDGAITSGESLTSGLQGGGRRRYVDETHEEGGSQAHNNMQPYTVVNYIIATGKGSGVSVQDVIMGVQALPLGIEYGGTGATAASTARSNLGAAPMYSYGTTDLTAGISPLETGKLYFVYE